jgi:hypothetical protein
MVGMRTMKANRSSMNVFTKRKHRKRQGRCDTLFMWWLMNSWEWEGGVPKGAEEGKMSYLTNETSGEVTDA